MKKNIEILIIDNKSPVIISDYIGNGFIYLINDTDRKKYHFPKWTKNYDSLNVLHPSLMGIIIQKKIPIKVVKKRKVKIIDFKTLIETKKISSINCLRIETKGRDDIILNDVLSYLKKNKNLKIYKIIFEYSYYYGNTERLDQLILSSGYKSATLTNNNVTLI